MAYSFPKAGTKAADMITPETRQILDDPKLAPTLKEARTRAHNYMRTSVGGANGVCSTCMLANDDIAIVFFGIRGAQRIVWNFGRAA